MGTFLLRLTCTKDAAVLKTYRFYRSPLVLGHGNGLLVHAILHYPQHRDVGRHDPYGPLPLTSGFASSTTAHGDRPMVVHRAISPEKRELPSSPISYLERRSGKAAR